MKALLVLCLAAAVYARPGPGFAYTVTDPASPALTYAVAPSVYQYAHQPVVYAQQPFVYAQQPIAVAQPAPKAGCLNNEGQVVPCIGEELLVAKAEAPETPEAPAGETPAAIPESSETETIVAVKKREADPVYYYNNIATPLTYAHTPVVYNYPAYAQTFVTPQMAYRACMNNQGSYVTCAQATPLAIAPYYTLAQTPVIAPIAPVAIEAKAEEPQAPDTPAETPAETEEAAVVSVKKREAEPLYYAATPYIHTPYVQTPVVNTHYAINTAPIVQTAYVHTPVVQVAPTGCRNDQGSVVPC